MIHPGVVGSIPRRGRDGSVLRARRERATAASRGPRRRPRPTANLKPALQKPHRPRPRRRLEQPAERPVIVGGVRAKPERFQNLRRRSNDFPRAGLSASDWPQKAMASRRLPAPCAAAALLHRQMAAKHTDAAPMHPTSSRASSSGVPFEAASKPFKVFVGYIVEETRRRRPTRTEPPRRRTCRRETRRCRLASRRPARRRRVAERRGPVVSSS